MPRTHKRGGTRPNRRPYQVSETDWLDCRIRIVVVYITGDRKNVKGDYFLVDDDMSLEDKRDEEWRIVKEMHESVGAPFNRNDFEL